MTARFSPVFCYLIVANNILFFVDVAVTGLPDPNKDHAVVMARFAFECLYHMHELTRSLENALGPGTTDLALRVGLHSGPVTAGVLRGEKSRFQLFGDTMNTAVSSHGYSCGIAIFAQTWCI